MLKTYHLGCPIWSNQAWVGELFSRHAKSPDYLAQYASVFNAVEGNTTFYGIPTTATVSKWYSSTSEDFRFSFKFPRAITHVKQLRHAESGTAHFLNRLAPLGKRLGTFMLQLPPSFSLRGLRHLERYLRELPPDFRYAVDVRHISFFQQPGEEALNQLLAANGADRVIFDTRALRTAPPTDPMTKEAQRKKPDLPTPFVALSHTPVLRFVAHPDVKANMPWLTEWATITADWIRDGRTPYIFMHAPDDFYAPRLARHFHRLLSEQLAVGSLPTWPAEEEGPLLQQLSFF